MPGSNLGQSGRYATIAAVVGLSRRDDSTQDEKEEDFLQRMMRPGGSNEENFIQPTKSKVRLVGVGRAVIRDYFYKVPSQLSDGSGEEYDEEEIIDWERNDFYDHGEEDYDDGYEDKTPIVMAEFTSLIDTGISPVNEDDLGSKKSRSAMSSEVHAIAELNRWVMRVNWMHDDRRKLVAGLNAAKARLNLSERRKKRGVEEWEKTKNESTMADGGDISRSSSINFHPLYEQNISIESYKETLRKETKYGLLAVSKRQIEDELMSLLGPSFNSIDKETFNTLEAMLICTVKRMKELEEKWVSEEELKYIDDTETKWDGSKAVIEYDDFADYDGFGFIAGGSIGRAESMRGGIESDDEVEEVEGGVEGTMSVEELTRRYGNKHENNVDQSGSMHDSEVNTEESIYSDNGYEKSFSPAKRIADMENYGLNYYSAFSTIRDLTKVAMQTFEPYFSPPYREREEYEAEISSFVAFRALEGYADVTEDVVWALVYCMSSTERLRRAYELMLEHRHALEELAECASDELRECGEECTDLW